MALEPRVYLIEDDDAVRDAVSLVLRAARMDVLAFADAETFLDAYRPDRAACLVLDARLPGMSGLDLQERINAAGWNLPVVLVTGHGDVPMATRALKAGAVDFIQKPINDRLLLESIAVAWRRAEEAADTAAQRTKISARLGLLTTREREVMELVVTGASNKLVAAELGISHRTVEIYRRRVMEKLGARSLPELVRIVDAVGAAGRLAVRECRQTPWGAISNDT